MRDPNSVTYLLFKGKTEKPGQRSLAKDPLPSTRISIKKPEGLITGPQDHNNSIYVLQYHSLTEGKREKSGQVLWPEILQPYWEVGGKLTSLSL